jgi:uncharacterized protein YuzE
MRFSYDPDVDILMVYLDDVKPRRTHGDRLPFGGAYADLAEDGTILAIEIEGASKKYSAAELAKFPPNYEKPMSLADAARVVGVTQQAMRKACERGRLRGTKIGRDWTTTIAALTEYVNSRAHEGPGSRGAVAAETARPAVARRSRKIDLTALPDNAAEGLKDALAP